VDQRVPDAEGGAETLAEVGQVRQIAGDEAGGEVPRLPVGHLDLARLEVHPDDAEPGGGEVQSVLARAAPQVEERSFRPGCENPEEERLFASDPGRPGHEPPVLQPGVAVRRFGRLWGRGRHASPDGWLRPLAPGRV